MKKYDVNKLREKLERCKKVSFDDITLDDVDDISTVKISKKQNEYEKILDFIENTKNPYIFKCERRFVTCRSKIMQQESSTLGFLQPTWQKLFCSTQNWGLRLPFPKQWRTPEKP